MKQEILTALLNRPGLSGHEEFLSTIIDDSISEMKSFLNYDDAEELPSGCAPAVKELALIHFNLDGAEGLQSESQSSGGSTTYMDALPDRVKRIVRKYRRLPRC